MLDHRLISAQRAWTHARHKKDTGKNNTEDAFPRSRPPNWHYLTQSRVLLKARTSDRKRSQSQGQPQEQRHCMTRFSHVLALKAATPPSSYAYLLTLYIRTCIKPTPPMYVKHTDLTNSCKLHGRTCMQRHLINHFLQHLPNVNQTISVDVNMAYMLPAILYQAFISTHVCLYGGDIIRNGTFRWPSLGISHLWTRVLNCRQIWLGIYAGFCEESKSAFGTY